MGQFCSRRRHPVEVSQQPSGNGPQATQVPSEELCEPTTVATTLSDQTILEYLFDLDLHAEHLSQWISLSPTEHMLELNKILFPLNFDFLNHVSYFPRSRSVEQHFAQIESWLKFCGKNRVDRLVAEKCMQYFALAVRVLLGKKPLPELAHEQVFRAAMGSSPDCMLLAIGYHLVEEWLTVSKAGVVVGLKDYLSPQNKVGRLILAGSDLNSTISLAKQIINLNKRLMVDLALVETLKVQLEGTPTSWWVPAVLGRLSIVDFAHDVVGHTLLDKLATSSLKRKEKKYFFQLSVGLVQQGLLGGEFFESMLYAVDLDVAWWPTGLTVESMEQVWMSLRKRDAVLSSSSLENHFSLADLLVSVFQFTGFSLHALQELPKSSLERKKVWLFRVFAHLVRRSGVPADSLLPRASELVSLVFGPEMDWEPILFRVLFQEFAYCFKDTYDPIVLALKELVQFVDSETVAHSVRECLLFSDQVLPSEYSKFMNLVKQFVHPRSLGNLPRLVELHCLVQEILFGGNEHSGNDPSVVSIFARISKSLLSSGERRKRRKLALLWEAQHVSGHYLRLSSLVELEHMQPYQILQHVFFFNPLALLETDLLQKFFKLTNVTTSSAQYPRILHLAAAAYIIAGEREGAVSIAERLFKEYKYDEAWRLAATLNSPDDLINQAIVTCPVEEISKLSRAALPNMKGRIEMGVKDNESPFPSIEDFPNLCDAQAVEQYLTRIGGDGEGVLFECAEILANCSDDEFESQSTRQIILVGCAVVIQTNIASGIFWADEVEEEDVDTVYDQSGSRRFLGTSGILKNPSVHVNQVPGSKRKLPLVNSSTGTSVIGSTLLGRLNGYGSVGPTNQMRRKVPENNRLIGAARNPYGLSNTRYGLNRKANAAVQYTHPSFASIGSGPYDSVNGSEDEEDDSEEESPEDDDDETNPVTSPLYLTPRITSTNSRVNPLPWPVAHTLINPKAKNEVSTQTDPLLPPVLSPVASGKIAHKTTTLEWTRTEPVEIPDLVAGFAVPGGLSGLLSSYSVNGVAVDMYLDTGISASFLNRGQLTLSAQCTLQQAARYGYAGGKEIDVDSVCRNVAVHANYNGAMRSVTNEQMYATMLTNSPSVLALGPKSILGQNGFALVPTGSNVAYTTALKHLSQFCIDKVLHHAYLDRDDVKSGTFTIIGGSVAVVPVGSRNGFSADNLRLRLSTAMMGIQLPSNLFSAFTKEMEKRGMRVSLVKGPGFNMASKCNYGAMPAIQYVVDRKKTQIIRLTGHDYAYENERGTCMIGVYATSDKGQIAVGSSFVSKTIVVYEPQQEWLKVCIPRMRNF